MPDEETRILCVDDEPRVLDGLENHLAMEYDLHTATSGAEGLEILEEHGPFALVISDMRMPVMNGAQFLSQVRQRHPDTTRMLLTGQSDIESAIYAINEGSIFRFLSKPCSPDNLLNSVKDGVRQHELIRAERDLLENTLTAAITVLTEVIGLATPAALRRSSSVLGIVQHLCQKLNLPDPWRYEMAARLSQLGCVTLPPETLEKFYAHQPLSEQEEAIAKRHPLVGSKLLRQIPRLELIAAMVRGQNKAVDWDGKAPESDAGITAAGRTLLHIALSYDALRTSAPDHGTALRELKKQPGVNRELAKLLADYRADADQEAVRALNVAGLQPKMILDEDVRTKAGHLIVGKGNVLSAALLERLRNFADGVGVIEPIRVRVPG